MEQNFVGGTCLAWNAGRGVEAILEEKILGKKEKEPWKTIKRNIFKNTLKANVRNLVTSPEGLAVIQAIAAQARAFAVEQLLNRVPFANQACDRLIPKNCGDRIEKITSLGINTLYGPAYSHCLSHCLVTRICGIGESQVIGLKTEFEQQEQTLLLRSITKPFGFTVEGFGRSAFQRSDFWDNEMGRRIAKSGMDCFLGCKLYQGGWSVQEGPGTLREFGPLFSDPTKQGPLATEEDIFGRALPEAFQKPPKDSAITEEDTAYAAFLSALLGYQGAAGTKPTGQPLEK